MKIKATQSEGKVNVGNTMVNTLKKNKSFDWQFVSREKADHEIKWVNILQVFTSHLSLHMKLPGHYVSSPQKADVEFKVNQKINAVASKLTDTGSSVVVEKANEQFNKTVTRALLEEANKAGLTIEENVPTINKIKMRYIQQIKLYLRLMTLRIKLYI